MAEMNLDGIESLKITRVDGNLTIAGGGSALQIDCGVDPQVTRDGGRAEVSLRSNATIRVPEGVAIEVSDCAGQLDLEDIGTPIALGRVAGNLRSRRTGTIAIRDRVAGNARVDAVGAIEGGEVAGNLKVENARTVSLRQVAGNFEAIAIDQDVAIERIGGSAFLDRVGGTVRARLIGGKLHTEDAGEIEVETVGGKARFVDTKGKIRIDHVEGRAMVAGAGGDLKIGTIGGHASISKVSGDLDLPAIGGALDLRGPFPAGKSWKARSRGRISVEVDAESSLEVSASAGWASVRVFGLDTGKVDHTQRSHLRGTLGAEKPDSDRTKMTLETRHADIIFAQAGPSERDYCWQGRGFRAGRRFPGAFDELAEMLSEELGEKIPDAVNSILGAAGQFVAGGGLWSSGVLRSVIDDAVRSVREAMGEAERAFDDLGEKLPRDIASSIDEFRRKAAEIIRRVMAEGRGRSREGRDEVRERIRAAAREMRDAIRAAVGEARARRESRTQHEPSPQEKQKQSASQTRPFTSAAGHGDIMDILNAVKEGRIEPAEADEMIAALMEVERATESGDHESR